MSAARRGALALAGLAAWFGLCGMPGSPGAAPAGMQSASGAAVDGGRAAAPERLPPAPERRAATAASPTSERDPDARMSLDFDRVAVRQLLPLFADFTGLNVLASDSVRGELTLRLNNVPWRQALQVVLDAAGLASREQGNVLWIAPRAEIAAWERQALQAYQQRAELEPLRTEVFRLNYARAEDVRQMLTGLASQTSSASAAPMTSARGIRGGLPGGASATGAPVAGLTPAQWPAGGGDSGADPRAQPLAAMTDVGSAAERAGGHVPPLALHASSGGASGARLLSWRGSVTSDPRTNQLIVSDLQERLQAVRSLLATIDIPARQVLIEARVVEADDSFSRNLGARLGFASPQAMAGIIGPHGGDSPAEGAVGPGRSGGRGGGRSNGASLGSPGNLADGAFFSMPAGALQGVAPAAVAVSLFGRSAAGLLALELSALEADGRGRILSTPRVVTADHARALIEQGTELPYQSSGLHGATSVQFRRANLRLEVTPQVTPEGHVLLDVDISKDSVGIQTTQGFAIDTRHLQTQVRIENGGTVMLGGIYTQTRRNDVTKVPVLGDLPGLGRLFRRASEVDHRTELLMFLTPRILDP